MIDQKGIVQLIQDTSSRYKSDRTFRGWLAYTAGFTFSVKHISSEENYADIPSRIQGEMIDESDDSYLQNVYVYKVKITKSDITEQEMKILDDAHFAHIGADNLYRTIRLVDGIKIPHLLESVCGTLNSAISALKSILEDFRMHHCVC